MPSIKFNQFTKEIELTGSESFIESNFNKIQDLLVGRNGTRKEMVSRKTQITQEPIQAVATDKTQLGLESKGTRPPLRKYIRKVGQPGQQRKVIEVVEQKPKEITLASLKEKFGLTDIKIDRKVRDAEQYDRIKSMNGPYA